MFTCRDNHSDYEFGLLLDTASTNITKTRELLEENPDLAGHIQMACSFPSSRKEIIASLLLELSGNWCSYENKGKQIARILGYSIIDFNMND